MDKALASPVQHLAHFAAEADTGKPGPIRRGKLAVEPGGAIATDLPVEVERRERPDGKILSPITGVMGHAALGQVDGDFPVVGVEALDMACARECVQATDIRPDEGVGIAADLLDRDSGPLQMLARPVDVVRQTTATRRSTICRISRSHRMARFIWLATPDNTTR
jgi:hypothetical protein